MATFSSASLSNTAQGCDQRPGFLAEVQAFWLQFFARAFNPYSLSSGKREPAIRGFWRQFFLRAFDPYRPELHYMRGPGPAWRAKQTAASRQRSN